MIIQRSIEKKLKENLKSSYLEVLNESNMHSVPPNSETHFKVIVVSEFFNEKSRINRHQLINSILAEEIAGPVHALSIQAHTEEEWQRRAGIVLASPDCVSSKKSK